MVDLPPGVHVVRSKGQTYYYWQPHRGTDRAAGRTLIGKDPRDPEFWDKLKTLSGDAAKPKAGSFQALVDAYKASKAYRNLRERTRESYDYQMERVVSAWADMAVAGLTVAGIYTLRAEYEDTPVSANHLVSVLRTVLKWGLQHGYGLTNPARDIEPIAITDEENARPWPEAAYRYVVASAPQDVRRAVYLGRATGQRRSDLVRLGKRHRDRDGLSFQIGKLRDKPHFIPLTKAQLAELDSWGCSDTGPWVVSPAGRPMNGDAINSAFNRFLAKDDHRAKLAKLSPGHKLTLHGLRAMAACDRKLLGMEDKAIGASIRMSPAMVQRYTRHIDIEALARGVRDGLERAGN